MKVLRCCVLTPPGKGAIAVILVRGGGAWSLVSGLIDSHGGPFPDVPKRNRVYYGSFREGEESIDDVLLAVSEHGGCNETVEISCHGGLRVVERILLALTNAGVTVVDGELLCDCALSSWQGKLRRIGMMLLSRASTDRGARFLIGQMDKLPAALEAVCCLAESGNGRDSLDTLRSLVVRSRGARFLSEPAEIALVGPTNAGKSSLANRLADRDHALVAETEGTTRDWVSISAAICGVPVTLLDTAGDRKTDDILERQAIIAGQCRVARCNLSLLVVDGANGLDPEAVKRWLEELGERAGILVISKSDCAQVVSLDDSSCFGVPVVRVSAKTGEGIEELQQLVVAALDVPDEAENEAVLFSESLRCELSEIVDEAPHKAAVLAERVADVLRSGQWTQ